MPVSMAGTAARLCALLIASGSTLLASGPAGAAATDSVVALEAGQSMQDVSRHLWFREGPGDARTVAEVIGDADRFELNREAILNPGTASGIIWARLDVRNSAPETTTFVASLNRATMETAEIYRVHGDRAEVLLGGSAAAHAASFRDFHTLAARFSLAPGEGARILVRYRGANWSGLQMTVGSERAFRSDQRARLVLFLLLLGGIATLVVYGSLSFVFLGGQIVLLYALGQISFFLFYAHMAGYTTVYLWPESPASGRIVAPATLAVFVLAMAQFARLFFDTRVHLPRLDRVLLGCLAGGGLALVGLPLDYVIAGFAPELPVRLLYAVTSVTWIVLPALAIHATLRWSRDFWPVAVAWASTAVFTIGIQLVFTGAIATIPLGKNAYGLVVYLEALFLAIAIALRIRGLRAEALDAQQNLNESLRRELEESRRAQRLSEERSWALQDLSEKGRLLLAAGHDSRQMISALRLYASGLRIGADDPALVEASRGIDEIASSLQDVLGSVVAGSGSGGIADRALALDTLTASSLLGPLQLIHSREASRKGIDLRVRASERLVATDRVLVMRALGNLVSNAIRYTDTGRIVVALRPRAGGSVFQVWDTGPGIDPDDLALLLGGEAGALRLDDRREGTGSGLGLVQELAARLGGRLDARSRPGRGSVFELVLPHRSGLADPPPHARVVVLLDRDHEKTALLEQAVRRAGWDFVRVQSSDEASEVLRDAGPADLLLVDQHFGRVDGGLDLARGLGESETARPLALLSYDRTAEARARLSAVAPVLLYKPVTVRALEQGAALLRAGGRAAPPPPSRE